MCCRPNFQSTQATRSSLLKNFPTDCCCTLTTAAAAYRTLPPSCTAPSYRPHYLKPDPRPRRTFPCACCTFAPLVQPIPPTPVQRAVFSVPRKTCQGVAAPAERLKVSCFLLPLAAAARLHPPNSKKCETVSQRVITPRRDLVSVMIIRPVAV